MIKNFSITGLFGDRDISIPFESDVKILVAENGSGKTTLLSAIYNTVACDFWRLRSLDFDSISMTFSSGVSVCITKDQLDAEVISNSDLRRHPMLGGLNPSVLQELRQIIVHEPPGAAIRNPRLRSLANRLGSPTEHLYNIIRRTINQPEQTELAGVSFKAARDAIAKSVNQPLLYFPTYRRVEEDLERLGFGEVELPTSDQLIKFGMNDVRESFEKITAQIKNSSIEWFSRINGQMLTQLVDGISITEEMRRQIENPEALKIVLDRIGENISQANKEHILDLVRNQKLNQGHYDPLVYFLANLIKVYDQQSENDNAIKEFTAVCNRYLGDKEVIYNESKVSIEVIRKKNGEVISISKLSSGEKQIISLFSKLYLDSTRPTAIFFDEPELSLSIEWQKQLLPHIVASKRCGFLIATTHSPFIFENELDSKTTDLTEYISLK